MGRLAILTLESDRRVHVAFRYDAILVQTVREIDARARFHGDTKTWSFPPEPFIVERLADLFALGEDNLPPGVRELLPRKAPVRRPADLDLINGYEFLGPPPYKHQRGGLAELLENDAWLLAWDLGSGKTRVVCDRLREGLASGEILSALILCPKSVMPTWVKQLRQYAGFQSWMLDGTKKQRLKILEESGGRLCIINYDALTSLEDELAKYKWDCVVGDEIQFCKRSTAQRSRAAQRIKAKHRYALSGTPAPNSPLDWHGVFMFLDPTGGLAGTRYKTAFEQRYAIYRQLEGGGRMVVGYRNLSDLNARVASVSSRVRKNECMDLPEKVFVTRTCELSGEAKRVYGELRKDAVTRLQKLKEESELTCTNVLTESLRLLQTAGGWVPADNGEMHEMQPNAKLVLFREVMEEIGPDTPIVIWTSFRQELAAITEWLTEQGRDVRALTGDTSTAERAAGIEDFRTGKANAWVGMVQAGGTGIDGLQERCSLEIFYSRTYNLAHWLQAQDRLHRGGQRHKVTVISLVAAGTVDEKVSQALADKESLMECMLKSPGVEELL